MTRKMYAAAAAKSLQSCLTLWDSIDSSPPGSAIPGILQARTLEWVAIAFFNAWKWKSESEVAQSCPHHLLEIVFNPLYIRASFVEDEVSIGVWIYLWAFCFVPLIYISVFAPVPYCLDDFV